MLEGMQRLVRWLAPLRPAFWLLALGAFVALAYLLVEGEAAVQDRWLLPLSMLLGWGLSLEALVLCFSRVPPRPGEEMGLIRRWRRRLKRALLGALAWLFLILLLSLGWMSLRAVFMPDP